MNSGHLPGQRSGPTYTPRNVALTNDLLLIAPGQHVMDADNAYDGANTSYEDEIRVGTLLAQITSTKLWVPCKRTTVTTAGASGSASAQGSSATVPVVDARAFKAGETVTVGGDTGKTISSINYSTNVITLSGAISYEPGDVVFCDSLAGSEICRGVLGEFVKLKDSDATLRDKLFSHLIIHGYLDDNAILGDLSAIRAATNYLNGILWGDYQQGL